MIRRFALVAVLILSVGSCKDVSPNPTAMADLGSPGQVGGALPTGTRPQQPAAQPSASAQQSTRSALPSPSRSTGSGAAGGRLQMLQGLVDSVAAPPSYDREVFSYPRMDRVDPVQLPAAVAVSAAFPDLELAGIVYDDKNPARSAALVKFRPDGQGIAGGEAQRHIVRAGDSIGQYDVVQVLSDKLVLDVRILGAVRRVELTAAGQGRSSAASRPSPTNVRGGPYVWDETTQRCRDMASGEFAANSRCGR